MSAEAPDHVARMAAALVTPGIGAAAPPGVDRAAFACALVEDACDLIAELENLAPAVAVSPAAETELGGRSVEELAWPGTTVLRLADGSGAGFAAQALRRMAGLGARQGAVVAADAPDMPLLLIGKLFRALGGARRRTDVAVCPADGGGLVALAAWLPAPDWVSVPVPPAQPCELDVTDVIDRLRHAAPRAGAVQLVPGWHRLRSPADVSGLDPGLEGWPATRSVLRPRR